MERRLYEASLSGNTQALNTLIKEDPLVLDRFTLTSFNETPLHIAALRGHLDFTRALLSVNPKLATELDSLGRSPLHLASAQGYTDIVRELLRVSTDVCLVRDHQGRIPLHLAVMKGRVEVIDVLVRARPESTMERLDRGDTVLHLCVKYDQFGALKKLIESVNEDDELIGSVDDDGNTILHVATALKQIETIKYLLSRRSVMEKANALNWNGFTALDVLEHSQSTEIRELFLELGVQRANDHLKPLAPPSSQPPPQPMMTHDQKPATTGDQLISSTLPADEAADHPPPPPPPQNLCCTLRKLRQILSNFFKYNGDWLEEARGNLMVTATVIATMAFQAGINPPGGFWQSSVDTVAGKNITSTTGKNITTVEGTAVLGDVFPEVHTDFIAYNTVSFVASLSIIMLMISGVSLKRQFTLWLLIATMAIAVTFMGLTYLAALNMTTPASDWEGVITISNISFYVLFGVFGILVVIHAAYFFGLIIKVWGKIIGVFLWMLKWLFKLLPKSRLLLPTTTTTSKI